MLDLETLRTMGRLLAHQAREKAAEYAALTRAVYELFVGRGDGLDYIGRRPVWLEEDVWPRIHG